MIDTFSGIGGFSLAARWLGGIETVQFVERDLYCRTILRKHWPTVPIHDDICTFNPAPGSADIVCGGFPCQDISTAGKQAGIKEGTRSGLFYELMRVVRLVGPRYIVLENVAAITSNGMDAVLGTLAEAGFDAEWACIPAADVGACHRRDRWWCVAYSNRWDGQSGQVARSAVHEQAACQGADGDAGSADEVGRDDSYANGQRCDQGEHARNADGAHAPQRADGLPDALAFIGDGTDTAYATKSSSDGSTVRSAANRPTQESRQRTEPRGGDCLEFSPHPHHQRQQERQPAAIASGTGRTGWGDAPRRLNPNWRSYLSEPVLRRGDDGLSGRVDRLKALGNAVVPQVAMVPLARVLELSGPQSVRIGADTVNPR